MSNPDRRDSRRARRICRETHVRLDHLGREYMVCHCGCKGIIYPKDTAWRADHNKRWADGGRDTPDNLYPIKLSCDAGKGGKAARDNRSVKKARRVSDKLYGYRARKGPPMMGSRDSPFKKRMDGTVVRR